MYYISFNEQQLPIQIDFACIKNVCNKLNLKISEIELIVNSPANTEVLCFEALKRGHKLDSKELLIKESECEDVLSESYADFLKIFNDSVLKMFTGTKKN